MEKMSMQRTRNRRTISCRLADTMYPLAAVAVVVMMCGCGSGTSTSAPTTSQKGPQSYMAPTVVTVLPGGNNLELYTIDDMADTFSLSTFRINLPAQQGPQVISAGTLTSGQRGLLELGTTATYAPNNSNVYVATTYDPPKPGGFALELADQAGGLIQPVGQAGTPLVAATQCPNSKTAQTYLFITTPDPLIASSSSQPAFSWNPSTETAYGSADVTSDGGTVTFNNIRQFTLPSVGGSGIPAKMVGASATGICGQTYLGNTISVPGQPVVQNPGGVNVGTQIPQATIGIGPTGFLVEDNGAAASAVDPDTSVPYKNLLGAGTGAVGLPKPASPLNVGTLVGAQYLGFVNGAGVYPQGGSGSTGWTSHLASFGFSSEPSTCASVAASTGTLIYGGDFTSDDPSTSSSGYGNCDLAIDLGTQDSSNNGLFPKATVWLGANFAGNTTKSTYSFSAVAIAGQLNGKSAIFILGVDSTQPWAIYLLQSN